jgi:hypothetical protein
MKNPDKNNQDINNTQDEISAAKSDINDNAQPADDGFKTGKQSHGLTWETPMDEQAFDEDALRMNKEDEEGN